MKYLYVHVEMPNFRQLIELRTSCTILIPFFSQLIIREASNYPMTILNHDSADLDGKSETKWSI